MMFDPASLIFYPDPDMSPSDLEHFMNQAAQAQKHLDMFKSDEINGADLCDALEFFGVDPVEFEGIVNENLDLMGL